MYLDNELLLSDAQDITVDAASENYIDLSAARDIGKGQPLYAVLTVGEDFDSAADDGTLAIKVQCDDNTAFSSAKTVLTTQAFAEAALVAGREPIVVALGPGINERYVRLYYEVAGSGNFTAGALTAAIVVDAQTNN